MKITSRHVLLLSLALGLGAARAAEGRIVAVLEHRAGLSTDVRISERLAAALGQLTSYAVIAPAEARRRVGATLESKVGRCKGEPRCIAGIGAQIPCDEVILVGLSELGHVIVAIQRIAVQSGEVLARLADSFQPTAQLAASTLEEYLRRLYPPDELKRYGQIVVHTTLAGARVYLDGALQRKSQLRVAAPGRYSITVRRTGHVPFVAHVDVLPDASVEITPTLTRISQPPKWYQRWWVWTIVGGVVAGSAAAAVLATRAPDTIPAYVQPR